MPSGTVTALLAETAVLPSRHTNNRKGGVAGEASFRTGATAPSKTIGNARENVCWTRHIHQHHRKDCRNNGLSGRWTSHDHHSGLGGHFRFWIAFTGSEGAISTSSGIAPTLTATFCFVSYFVLHSKCTRLLCTGRGRQKRDELLQTVFVHCLQYSVVVLLYHHVSSLYEADRSKGRSLLLLLQLFLFFGQQIDY